MNLESDYPYLLTVTADGTDTYTKKWTPTQKITWEIALTPKTGFASGFGLGFILKFLIFLVLGLAGVFTYTKK